MKIKNIQQYRNIYKNEVRKMSDRDENFIGNFYSVPNSSKVKGWFDIYFGDTDGSSTAQNGVKNKLKSFLDMAKDGQAVYEFLQNAVDAGGTKFLMFYKRNEESGSDYLLVMNNGEMFSPASIRSILNIGSSTKANSSDKIGQFGIGFKLAHRLVGKDDALDELVNNLNGPILYSWKNGEVLNFSDNVDIQDLKYEVDIDENIIIENDDPWLFKILLTTFPCSFDETPIIWDGQKAAKAPFSKDDIKVLHQWLKEDEVSNYLTTDFHEGSLFLMKLGEGKLKELKEEPNLNLGVKFSLAVLKETSSTGKALQTAVINGVEVNHPSLLFHKFQISKDESEIDDYSYIRFGRSFKDLSEEDKNTLESENAIEVLFGYRKYNEIGEYFKGSPSFYLYFPVSQEVHNFNFIIHSNALYKGSSRVFLQSGGGVGLNERLFRKIIERLQNELFKLFNNDKSKYLDLYAAFLTSGETNNNESKWVTDCFTNPLNSILKQIVPIKKSKGEVDYFNLSQTNSNKIFILDSKIKFISEHNYFYFENTFENGNIIEKAIEKLSLTNYNLFDILNNQYAYKDINNWLGEDKVNIEDFYIELTTKVNKYSNLSDFQKDNLVKIKWIQLTDGSVKSIEEIEGNPIFLLNDRMYEVTEILQKLNLVVSEQNLEEFIQKFNNNFRQSELRQFGYTVFTKLFSENVPEDLLEKLSNLEKFNLFEAFRENGDNPGERIRFLKIYKNNIGNYQVFGKMLNLSGGLAGLLSIDENQLRNIQNTNVLRNYLKADPSILYEKIYYPQWKDLLTFISSNESNLSNILGELDYAYRHSNWEDKVSKSLSDSNIIIYKGKIKETKFVFVHQSELQNHLYYQENLEKFYKTFLPDEKFTKLFSNNMPFGYKSELADPELLLEGVSKKNLNTILSISRDLEINFFENNTVVANDENYNMVSGHIQKQYFTDKDNIIDFFNQYGGERFKLLPTEFKDFSTLVQYKKHELNYALSDFIINNRNLQSFATEAMDLLVSLDDETRKNLFHRLDYIIIGETLSDENNAKILRFLVSLATILDLEELRNKIRVLTEEIEITLQNVLPQIPSIRINNQLINFTSLFPNETNEETKYIKGFFEKHIVNKFDNVRFFKGLLRIDSEQDNNELKVLFLKSLNDENEIINIYQLYFLLFSECFSKDEISNFYIINNENDFVALNSHFYLYTSEQSHFFNPNTLLNEVFNIEKNLIEQICGKDDLEQISISADFLLTKSTNYLNLNQDVSLVDKLEFVYHSYSKTPSDLIYCDISSIDIYFNIVIEQKLINDLSLEKNELIKGQVANWINEDEKKMDFLKNIGFRFEDDRISTLINQIILDSHEFQSLGLNSFTNEELSFIHTYFLEKNISFNLKNENILKFIIQFFQNIRENIDNKAVLVYQNSTNIKFELLQNAYIFNYDIIEQIFENSDSDILTKLLKEYNIIYKEIAEGIDCENTVDLDYEILEDSVSILEGYFYNEWKKEVKNINIYQADELHYKIKANLNDQHTEICNVKFKDDSWLLPIGNSLKIFFTSDKSIKYVVDYFSSSSYDAYASYNLKLALKKLEELYNSANATITEALKSLDHEEIKEILQNQIEKEERRLERELIVTDIKESKKYSTEWFLKYLEYLNTVNDKNSSSDNKTIRFKELHKTDKAKFYKLSACNSIIPENIDESKDVKIKLYFGKNTKTIKITSISQKNQKVLIQLDESLPDELIKNFFMAEITYQPTIDLLNRLRVAFQRIRTWEDIETEFPPINYIYGPPGTGKTTTLKEKIKTFYKKNSKVKILVLAPTNKACDVLAEKLNEDGFSNFIRLSSPTSEVLPEDFYRNDLSKDTLDNTNVLISTIHRHSYFKVNTEHSQFYLYDIEDYWDYIIIDEASMINLPYITFSSIITKQKNFKSELIIAGDPRQIPPVPELSDNEREEIEIDTENIYSMFGLHSFDKISQDQEIRKMDSVKNLITQYRSLPEIGELFSKFSYKDSVKTKREASSRRILPNKIQEMLSSTITFLDIPLEKDNQLFSINKLIYSSYHLYSCILINEFIKYFDQHNTENEKWTIGIISPYKAQAVLCNRLNAGLSLKTNLQVVADTVHGFQGDECDIVFYISNPSSYQLSPHPKSLLSNDFIYNVAISRAKDYLIMVNPFLKLTENQNINRLKTIYKEISNSNVKIVNASDFEKIMFKQMNYIDDNTFITNHDDVNVYSEDVYKYFIKKNSVSIDLQISDTRL